MDLALFVERPCSPPANMSIPTEQRPEAEHPGIIAATPLRLLNLRMAISRFIFRDSIGFRTRRLGPTTYLKAGPHVDATEAATMLYIASNTSIPVPKIQRVWRCGEATFITMDVVPGKELQSAWHTMSEATKRWIVKQLKGYLDQLRSLTPPTEGRVVSVTGGPLRDGSRIGLHPFGPFESHDEFHQFLRGTWPLKNFENSANCDKIVSSHHQRYATKFSHGDFAPRNVMVKSDGTITGIIDWDSAGWFPEYWEYTKANFTPYAPDDWVESIGEMTGRYPEQLDGERQLYTACGSDLT